MRNIFTVCNRPIISICILIIRDIMPLMRQPKLVGRLCQAVADHIHARGGVHVVAGLEARGE